MVSIFLPLQLAANVKQELTSRPSMMTLQAPHTPMLQPSLVPVRPRLSRSTWSNSRLASTSRSCSWPFTVKVSCFFILDHQICWDLVGPTSQPTFECLHESITY